MKAKIGYLILLLWFLKPLLFRLICIDFINKSYAENFRQFWLILIPFALGLIVYDKWKKKKINSAGPLILISCSVFVIFISNSLANFCGWTISKPIYTHKTKKEFIKYRKLDCGAGDSDPSEMLVITKPLTSYLYSYQEIELSDIKLEDWIKN